MTQLESLEFWFTEPVRSHWFSSTPELDREIHTLYELAGLSTNLQFARHHREIIRRFGRFPHRNAILARQNTREELDWLNSKEAFTG